MVAGISIIDIDAGNGIIQVSVSAAHGILNFTTSTAAASAVVRSTARRHLQGTLVQLNAALATLTYMPDRDYNGSDTLTVVANDRGQLGDANGNLMPGENPGDALTDTGTVTIVITPVNDLPAGCRRLHGSPRKRADASTMCPDSPARMTSLPTTSTSTLITNNDTLRVTSISFGATTVNLAPAPDVSAVLIDGQYGQLVVFPNGRIRYNIDNSDPAVEALRTTADTLSETFTYTLADLAGAASSAQIFVTIRGANDAPVAGNDVGAAVEAGGVNNGNPGSDATGDVLANDIDVDAFGETRAVTGIRTGKETVVGGDKMNGVAPGTDSSNGTVVVGTYGTLTIGADGSYRYVVDNANPDVERLAVGDTLQETFSYLVSDKDGLTDIANLVIDIEGRHDNPLASDDVAAAQAQSIVGGSISGGTVVGGTEQGIEVNPVGNVITIASRLMASRPPETASIPTLTAPTTRTRCSGSARSGLAASQVWVSLAWSAAPWPAPTAR